MKKKSPRGIPDFSSKKPNPAQFLKNDREKPPTVRPPTPAPQVKPQSTSMKSGRRGQ